MGTILTTQSNKGGTGKTTLATHLAQGLSMLGYKVMLVDSDPQASARDWMVARSDKPKFDFMALDRPTLHRDIPAIASNYDVAIIDGSPRSSDLCRSAIMASDLILMPVSPSPYDIWAVAETVKLILEVQIIHPHKMARFVLNRKVVNSVIARDTVEALSGYAIEVMKSQISQRLSFAEAAATGMTVLDFKNQASCPARVEILKLVEEVSEYIKGALNFEKN